MTFLQIPNITDWISAIAAAIGIPLALVGFIKLIRRDKDRQKEINSLVELSKSQAEGLEEMKKILLETQKQTQQLEFQTNHMKDLNDIFKEYFTTISLSLAQDKEYQGALLGLESKKRKTEIKPHFIFSGGIGQGSIGSYQLRLKNIGKTAYLKDLIFDKDCPIDFFKGFDENKMVNENQEITITGQIKPDQGSVNVVPFSFELLFVDADNNKYKQRINRFSGGGSFKIENPQEINE